MKLALVILLATCLTVHANPFRPSLLVDTQEGVTYTGAERVRSVVDILLRNLVVGPPKGAEGILLKVSSDKDRTSDEIAAIIKEREDQIKRGNQNDENPKTERVINVVEDIYSENDFNQRMSGEEAGNADSNLKADGRQSNEPNKTDSNTNNNKAATGENNNKNGNSPKSYRKASESATANKPIANNSKSAKNSNAGETNANAANDIEKNSANNANESSANNNRANDNKQQQEQQKQQSMVGSDENVVTINDPTAENSGSDDSQSNEGQNDDGNSASERNVRNTKKSEGNNAGKSISGKYVAKEKGTLHITPSMGHILSVKMTK